MFYIKRPELFAAAPAGLIRLQIGSINALATVIAKQALLYYNQNKSND
jgi:hypothetical protein